MPEPQPGTDRPADGSTPATGRDRDPVVSDEPTPSPASPPAGASSGPDGISAPNQAAVDASAATGDDSRTGGTDEARAADTTGDDNVPSPSGQDAATIDAGRPAAGGDRAETDGDPAPPASDYHAAPDEGATATADPAPPVVADGTVDRGTSAEQAGATPPDGQAGPGEETPTPAAPTAPVPARGSATVPA
ncbi:hypothetical protein DLJ46_30625, partial [Micromonospora globispora]